VPAPAAFARGIDTHDHTVPGRERCGRPAVERDDALSLDFPLAVAALRGNPAAAYAASKAFQTVYLDGLRDLARQSGYPIAVTEVQPGAVDTAMLKPDHPLPALIRRLFVASPEKAARQILRAIQKRKKHAYITKRYAPVAFILKLLPRPG